MQPDTMIEDYLGALRVEQGAALTTCLATSDSLVRASSAPVQAQLAVLLQCGNGGAMVRVVQRRDVLRTDTNGGAMSGSGQVNTKCFHCGSSNILPGLKVGQTAEVGQIGLNYQAFIVTETEPFYAELCQDCGTVTRLYVKTPHREWVTAK